MSAKRIQLRGLDFLSQGVRFFLILVYDFTASIYHKPMRYGLQNKKNHRPALLL